MSGMEAERDDGSARAAASSSTEYWFCLVSDRCSVCRIVVLLCSVIASFRQASWVLFLVMYRDVLRCVGNIDLPWFGRGSLEEKGKFMKVDSTILLLYVSMRALLYPMNAMGVSSFLFLMDDLLLVVVPWIFVWWFFGEGETRSFLARTTAVGSSSLRPRRRRPTTGTTTSGDSGGAGRGEKKFPSLSTQRSPPRSVVAVDTVAGDDDDEAKKRLPSESTRTSPARVPGGCGWLPPRSASVVGDTGRLAAVAVSCLVAAGGQARRGV